VKILRGLVSFGERYGNKKEKKKTKEKRQADE
jgi:hypothetical protein